MAMPTPKRIGIGTLATVGMLVISAAASLPRASAAELLMFEEAGCPWCKRWHAEVGPGYPKSTEGQRAPLRRIMLEGPKPAGIVLASPVSFSPTFVLVENGREIGRITGYPGADFFWGLLAELIQKLDRSGSLSQSSLQIAKVELRP